MRTFTSVIFGVCLVGLLTADLPVWAQNDAAQWEREAREVVDDHIRASNCGSAKRAELARQGVAFDAPCDVARKQYWGAGNFPWVSIAADGGVSTRAATAQDAQANIQRGEPKIDDCRVVKCQRDHTTWELKAVQVSATKVSFTSSIIRRDMAGKPYETVSCLWIVTRQNGRWGITAQSWS